MTYFVPIPLYWDVENQHYGKVRRKVRLNLLWNLCKVQPYFWEASSAVSACLEGNPSGMRLSIIFRQFFNQMTVVQTRARVRTLKRCKSHEEKENQRKNAKNPPFAIIMLWPSHGVKYSCAICFIRNFRRGKKYLFNHKIKAFDSSQLSIRNVSGTLKIQLRFSKKPTKFEKIDFYK